MIALQQVPEVDWATFRYLTCSALPVARACDCRCKFCFSHSSLSALPRRSQALDVDRYFQFACARGATRLVITGGGEPLLQSERCVEWIERGSRYFGEIALFTNGSQLTSELAQRLKHAGLSYLCYSRHHHLDAQNTDLMGPAAPQLEAFFSAAEGLRVRATCVMARGFVDDTASAERYVETLARYGVAELPSNTPTSRTHTPCFATRRRISGRVITRSTSILSKDAARSSEHCLGGLSSDVWESTRYVTTPNRHPTGSARTDWVDHST